MGARTGKTKLNWMIFLMDKFDAAGLIVRLGDLVLLGKRSKLCINLSGFWSMPCGAIEKDELPKSAAIREFFEETGCDIKSEINYLTSFKMENGGTFYAYLAETKDLVFPSTKAKDALEHDEWGYFKMSKNSLPNPITKELKKIILKLK